jgi:hypothetical protein
MFQAWFSQLLDEVAANFLLHQVLWHRRRAPVRGPTPAERPALYSGALDSFFAPVPSPVELAADRTLFRETNTATVWDYRFASETATPFPENDSVWCRHWQTGFPDRGMTVVGVDGIVQLGTTWFRRLAKELNPRGIDVLSMDAPFNFRRTPAGYRPGQLIVGGDMGHQLAVVRQAVLDLWRVIATLQREGRRVGLVGVSYGGWITLLTSLLADNLEFLIAVVPPVDIIRMLREGGTMVRAVRRGIGRYPFDLPELERVARPIIPGCWPKKLPGAKIALHAARYDRLAPCRNIEDLSARWRTRLVLHSAGHFHLANSPRIFPEMAEEICAFWQRVS